MKKVLSLILAILIILTPTVFANAEENYEIEEYHDLIFIIDRSMYTSQEQLASIKQNVVDYSDIFLSTNPQVNSVSIIDYSTWANLLVNKSQDIEEIKTKVNKLYSLGFSDVTGAVKLANQIPTSHKKYVVMFSNFYPNVGALQVKGSYTANDHLYFRNANALESQFAELKNNSVIFALSNFEKMNTKDFHFSNRIFKENTDYHYNFSSIEQLEKSVKDVFEKISLDFGNSEQTHTKNPIVFIPGVSGSELFYVDQSEVNSFEESIGSIIRQSSDSAKRIWLPFGLERDEINQYFDANQKVYGLQQGNLRNVPLIDRHYGPMALYMPLLNKLMDTFPDREVYLFSYDWRQTNEETEEQLNNFIQHITENRYEKIDLIAHSMGGIISALYLEKHPDMVDKYVSFGTPYEGAPKSFNQLAVGNVLGGVADFFLKDIFGIDLKLPNQYDSIVELFPTKSLIEKYPYQLITDKNKFNDILNNRFNYIDNVNVGNLDYDKVVLNTNYHNISKPISYEDLSNIMVEKIGLTRFNNFLDVVSKYRENRDFNRNVNVLNRDNSLFFVGRGVATEVSAYVSMDETGYKVEKILLTKEGDSLVPLYSATMGIELSEMPDDLRDKFVVRDNDHLFMLSDPYNLNVLVNFLSNR